MGTAELSESLEGRYDSALVTLGDGRRVVVRIPVDLEADRELITEAGALRALTAGVRGLLPFTAPTVLGTARIGEVTALVQEFVKGYRVDAAHIPAGRGVAWSIGAAIARVHGLPTAVVRDAGLPARSSSQVRDDVAALLDRAEATGELPFGLLRRWSTALGSDRLWRFETTVTLGGVDPGRFVFTETAAGPAVSGLITWHGLGVGDPARDLRWLASAPAARDDVLRAYADAALHTPDAALGARSRLYAELEFAQWLAHGHETGSSKIVGDAVALLTSLDESVRDEPLDVEDGADVDDALELLDRTPATVDALRDTSMQTDTYDPALLQAYLGDDDTAEQADIETVPIDLSDWTPEGTTSDHRSAAAPADDDEPGAARAADTRPDSPSDDETDPEHAEAARNTLRRWASTE